MSSLSVKGFGWAVGHFSLTQEISPSTASDNEDNKTDTIISNPVTLSLGSTGTSQDRTQISALNTLSLINFLLNDISCLSIQYTIIHFIHSWRLDMFVCS